MDRLHQERLESDFLRKKDEVERGVCDLDQVGLLDLAMGYRLLFGRAPTQAEIQQFQVSPPGTLDRFMSTMLASPEFRSRTLAVEFERPHHDCLAMTETPEGLRFFFSLRDTFVGLPVAVGVFERDVDAVLRRLLRPGMNCLDIGANLGYYSVRMAAVVAQGGGRVFSFEPDAFAFSLLSRNRQENHLENVITLFPVACGQHEAIGVLVRDPNPSNYGGSHMREDTQNGNPTAIRRVDDMVPPDMRIDLVKIDIEGFELFALRGMSRILATDRPTIVMEFNPPALRAHGENAPDLVLRHLAAAGYHCFETVSFAGENPVPFVFPGPSGDGLVNLVCVPVS
jgi:FkbM family methyltransferase